MRAKGPETFAFARINVPDVAASAHYYERNVGLEPAGQDDGRVYLRAGTPHHCIELVQEAGLKEARTVALGFAVDSSETFEGLRERIEKEGLPVLPTDHQLQAVTAESFAVDDPNGMRFEFFTGFHEYAEPPFSPYCPIDMLHPLTITDKYEESFRSYTELFGFQVSDYITDIAVFLRAEDRYHHSMVIVKGKRYAVVHLAFLMPNFDVMMRMRSRAMHDGVPIVVDLVRHSGSGSISFYEYMPEHGPRIELCDGHRRFDEVEHEDRRPRRLAGGARNVFDLWRTADDDFRDGELVE
jgi:catechol 2,3-dioxygenase-like lactoylglutathione lyase family enzyme